MAKRGSGDVDNFAYVQAVKRASVRSNVKPKIHESTGVETPVNHAVERMDATQPAVTPLRVGGQVAVPTKRLIICYVCGYSHTVAGKMHNSFCPKCKTKLVTEDLLVNGLRTEDIQTIGNVTIEPEAQFSPGIKILGQNIVLNGDVTPVASITATESLELRSNAKFSGVELKNASGKVFVAAEHTVELEGKFTCRELHIRGHLTGTVEVLNSAHVYAGGFLEGAFRGPTLDVDDGAGLVADVDLSPTYYVEPPKPTTVQTVRRVASAVARILLFVLPMI